MIKKIIGALAVVGVLVGGYFLYTFSAVPKELTPVTVSPKWVNQAQFAGLYVALDKGFFEKEGLDVTIKEFESGSPLDDLKNGTSQFGYASANEVLGGFAEGRSIYALQRTIKFELIDFRQKPQHQRALKEHYLQFETAAHFPEV